MEYGFNARLKGKSYSQMIQIKHNIEKGLDCAVATMNPEKIKQDFKYVTGSELLFTKRSENIYTAVFK